MWDLQFLLWNLFHENLTLWWFLKSWHCKESLGEPIFFSKLKRVLPLIHENHFASFSPDAAFVFSQLNLKWELPSQQKPLISVFSGIVELLPSLEGSYCPLAFWVALMLKLAPARLHVPVSSRTACLGMTAVSLRLNKIQLCLSLCAQFCTV